MIRAGSEMGRAGGSVDASALAKFIVQAADLTLPNAQDLSALANGLLLNTAGVLSKGTANTDFMAALAGSGIAKVAAGVPALASAGVDYGKGPWKTFSTVRNVGAAQTLSIPVVDAEGNGLIQAMGRIIGDGAGRVVTLKINGSATNVTQQTINAQGNAAASGITARVGAQTTLAVFVLVMHTAKLGGIRRAGVLTWLQCDTASGGAISQYSSGFHFNDTTTVITSIDLDCGNATGMAAGSEAVVQEGIAS